MFLRILVPIFVGFSLLLSGCSESADGEDSSAVPDTNPFLRVDTGTTPDAQASPCNSQECDDGNPCTLNGCLDGSCFVQPLNGDDCEDGNACSVKTKCQENGTCSGGTSLICDDGDTCTADLCTPAFGCVFETAEEGETCNDGNPCTFPDGCVKGVCNGAPVDCEDDGNSCTLFTGCEPEDGACIHVDLTPDSACDDGNFCTEGDACDSGVCIGGPPTECNDSNPCTDDLCSPKSGCAFAPNQLQCDDGDACTQTDFCFVGVCTGTPVVCEDENPCTYEECSTLTGGCDFTYPSIPCNDGNPCTVGDLCSEGLCASGMPQLCDDGNSCTTDGCILDTGECTFTANENPCDDEDQCTGGDVCASGSCVGAPVNCDDGNSCTTDTCSESTGCGHLPTSGGCDDSNACTTGDICSGGTCSPGNTLVCDDNNPCTDDTCSLTTGECVFTETTAPCSDGNACTKNDTCSSGSCAGETLVCLDEGPCSIPSCDPEQGCISTPTEGPCDDGNLCTLGDQCSGGACVAGTLPLCQDNNPCTFDVCNPTTGECGEIPQPGSCDDGNFCTEGDACDSGVCIGGPPTECNDSNPCTDDLCSPQSGCAFAPNQLQCDDGDACTLTDLCFIGVCTGTPVVCDDENPCTAEECSTSTGDCNVTYPSISCNDGNPCTVGDLCSEGLCASGMPQLCDDGNSCTTDACILDTGECTFTLNENPCNDEDLCTTIDTCTNGECLGEVTLDCDDGNFCTDDSCFPETGCLQTDNNVSCTDNNSCSIGDTCNEGSCVPGEFFVCSDGNPCTSDACEPVAGCVFTPLNIGCEDGDPCTTNDICLGASCLGGFPTLCDDGNICTLDSCLSGTGCLALPTPGPCDDENLCTLGDTCSSGFCVGTVSVTCDDSDVCTDNVCSATEGCSFPFNNADCEDNDACTSEDACSQGNCAGPNSIQCNDGNPCTTDVCFSAFGCSASANSFPCNDGNLCTESDECSEGSCQPGTALECDDQNPCTTDSCIPSTGCQFLPNEDSCDDGNICTEDDNCSFGACAAGPEVNCDDGKVCTSENCFPTLGCQTVNLSSPCDDGNLCTEGDTCGDGACAPGTALSCDDQNSCTSDACFPEQGCQYFPLEGTCDDGNTCTDGDLCSSGTCIPGTPVICEDCDICTLDECVPSQGCVHTVAALPCSDGDGCTLNDTCEQGVCVGSVCADGGLACVGTSCSEPTEGCFSHGLNEDGASVGFQTGDLTGSFTLEFQIWLDELASFPASTHLFYVQGSNESLLIRAQESGAWTVSWGATGEEDPTSWNSIGQSMTNKWLHVALTYESTTGTRKLFIDGTLVASNAGVPLFSPGDVLSTSLGKGPEPLVAYPSTQGRFGWARISSISRYATAADFQGLVEEADAFTENLYLMRARPDGVLVDDSFYWRHGTSDQGVWLDKAGAAITDADDDGYAPCEGDCNDENPWIHPGRAEICGDNIDNNCDGAVDTRDYDEDGYEGCSGEDCNDFAASVFPNAPEIEGDGIDNDCNGIADSSSTDDDGDGWAEIQGDCNDAAPWIHPAAMEIADSGVDEDCSGSANTLSQFTTPVFFVDGDAGSDFFTGTKEFPKKSIGSALSISQTGDTLIVRGGDYTENLTISGQNIIGGYDSNWQPGSTPTQLDGTLTIAPLAPITGVLSRVNVVGNIAAGVASGATLYEVNVNAPQGAGISTNSARFIVANSHISGQGSAPSSHTAAISVGTGGISLWNTTVLAGTGSAGDPGVVGICCGIGVSAGTPGGKGESLYALLGETGEVGSCCDDSTGPGCGDSLCEECVCALEPSCCSDAWSPACVVLANQAPCSILGCKSCTGGAAAESLVSGSLLHGGIAGDGGTGGNAYNGSYVCGTPGTGGDAITVSIPTLRIQGSALHTGISGDGASQIGVTGYSSTCNGGDGGRTAGILSDLLTLQEVTILAETRPGQSLGGLASEPVTASPQGAQTFENGKGGILEGIQAGGDSTLEQASLQVRGESGTLREITGIALVDGTLNRTDVRLDSSAYAEGVRIEGSATMTNSLIHHVLYPGVAVHGSGEGALLSSNTVVCENPGAGILLSGNNAIGFANNIVQTGLGGTCIQNESATLSVVFNNLLDGCANQLYYDGLYRTQALELDFLLENGASGGHLFTSPEFLGHTEGNFALAPCSPAINAGVDASPQSLGGIFKDIIGTLRPFANLHDIGAYEYFSKAP